MSEMERKVALLTGGAIGIDRAIYSSLAATRADVAFTYLAHDPDVTSKNVRERGRRVRPIMLPKSEEHSAPQSRSRWSSTPMEVVATSAFLSFDDSVVATWQIYTLLAD